MSNMKGDIRRYPLLRNLITAYASEPRLMIATCEYPKICAGVQADTRRSCSCEHNLIHVGRQMQTLVWMALLTIEWSDCSASEKTLVDNGSSFSVVSHGRSCGWTLDATCEHPLGNTCGTTIHLTQSRSWCWTQTFAWTPLYGAFTWIDLPASDFAKKWLISMSLVGVYVRLLWYEFGLVLSKFWRTKFDKTGKNAKKSPSVLSTPSVHLSSDWTLV